MTDKIDTEEWVDQYITGLIDHSGLDVFIEELSLDDDDVIHVQLAGPDSARVIGREGQALDSLQHLVVASAIHAGARKQRILVDVEDYRVRRENRVRDDAIHFAEEALDTGDYQDLFPMSPRERRLVHMALADMDGISTESVGQGEDRFVRIVPTRQ